MADTMTAMREQRLQRLFDDCEKQVLSQLIGPFGLSLAMFEDRNGGNVTTVLNFSREDDGFIADKDKRSFEQSRKDYDRKDYTASHHRDISKRVRESGVDGLTGEARSPDQMDADHVKSLKAIHDTKKMHLALQTGESWDAAKTMANAPENLVATSKSINTSKRSTDLEEFMAKKGEQYGLDPERVAEVQARSDEHINSTVNSALLKKQGKELLETGSAQALLMGLRQAFGVLLVELVNGLFNEFKALIVQGIELGQALLEDLARRLLRVAEAVARKIPDALGQLFQGGVSGFVSNLLTFLLNNLVSTAKRFVTAIREGVLGLVRAFRMILRPPATMTAEQGLREGLKLLTAVVASTVGILIQESVTQFMTGVPFLVPIGEIVAPALVGIVTGLVSAFAAYQIDCFFDRRANRHDEKLLDELLADARRREAFASELGMASEISLAGLDNYAKAIELYGRTAESLAAARLTSGATLASLDVIVAETEAQIAKSNAMVASIASSQVEIEEFLATI